MPRKRCGERTITPSQVRGARYLCKGPKRSLCISRAPVYTPEVALPSAAPVPARKPKKAKPAARSESAHKPEKAKPAARSESKDPYAKVYSNTKAPRLHRPKNRILTEGVGNQSNSSTTVSGYGVALSYQARPCPVKFVPPHLADSPNFCGGLLCVFRGLPKTEALEMCS